MGMPALSEPLRWTVEMVHALPDDGNRYECVDGALLVTPGPWNPHQAVVGEFFGLLRPYVREMRLGYVQVAPTDVEVDAATVVQPDVLVFRLPPVSESQPLRGQDLLLVIEIVSPSTVSRDRGLKRKLYRRLRVGEYWVVDRAQRRVERWRRGATTVEFESGLMEWHPEGAPHPLTIDLPALFDAIPELPDRLRVRSPRASG